MTIKPTHDHHTGPWTRPKSIDQQKLEDLEIRINELAEDLGLIRTVLSKATAMLIGLIRRLTPPK